MNQKGYGEVSTDGSIDEWDLSDDGPDFIGNMHEAGELGKEVAAKFYARMQCSTGTLCIMINSMPNTSFLDSIEDTWFKNYNEGPSPLDPLGDGIVKVMDGDSFVAWEACYEVPMEEMNNFEIHTNYCKGPDDKVCDNTASTGTSICMETICDPGATPAPVPVDPTDPPTGAPQATPTDPPTGAPTGAPNATPTDPPVKAPIPSPAPPCPGDIPDVMMISQFGGDSVSYEDLPIEVISRNSNEVEFIVTNTWEKEIEYLYTQFTDGEDNTECVRKDMVPAGESYVYTSRCRVHNKITLVSLFISDPSMSTVVTDDSVEIPRCCHGPENDTNPKKHYLFKIYCECPAPEVDTARRHLRGV